MNLVFHSFFSCFSHYPRFLSLLIFSLLSFSLSNSFSPIFNINTFFFSYNCTSSFLCKRHFIIFSLSLLLPPPPYSHYPISVLFIRFSSLRFYFFFLSFLSYQTLIILSKRRILSKFMEYNALLSSVFSCFRVRERETEREREREREKRVL